MERGAKEVIWEEGDDEGVRRWGFVWVRRAGGLCMVDWIENRITGVKTLELGLRVQIRMVDKVGLHHE